MAIVEHQYAELRPPRRGLVLAITTDTTGRAYDLSALDIGNDGTPPLSPGDQPRTVLLFMQADTNDVYFHFSPDSTVTLDNTAAVAAGAAAVYSTTYGALLRVGTLAAFRINRQTDRYLVIKAATAGVIRVWAASADST